MAGQAVTIEGGHDGEPPLDNANPLSALVGAKTNADRCAEASYLHTNRCLQHSPDKESYRASFSANASYVK